MADLCPNLEKLHLHLCGQLMSDTLKYWGKNLTQLKRVELFAPFLVRKDGWKSLLEDCGERLEGFLITQSPRIDTEIVQDLVKLCPNITELRLAEIGQLDGDCLVAISHLRRLTLLDLSAPDSSLNDDDVIKLLSNVGATLQVLELSNNPELTDLTLSAIAQYCPCLVELRLRNLFELTNQGVAEFFTAYKESGHAGLSIIDLEKGHDLQDDALEALLSQSGNSVQTLNILGWRNVSARALENIAHIPVLRDLNLGWCRTLNDFALKEILVGCPAIESIRVWGEWLSL